MVCLHGVEIGSIDFFALVAAGKTKASKLRSIMSYETCSPPKGAKGNYETRFLDERKHSTHAEHGFLPTFLRKVDSFVPSSIENLDINMNFCIPFVFPPRVSNRLPCSLCLAADVDNHLCDIIGK